jgi:hypothetical protein
MTAAPGRSARSPRRDLEPLCYRPGVHLGEGSMHKLNCFRLLATLLAFIGLAGAHALGAELEGALQYPPRSMVLEALEKATCFLMTGLIHPAPLSATQPASGCVKHTP